MEYKPGMMVKSIAGHDKNSIYVIIRECKDHVYVCDGKLKMVEKPKKKNKKHVQLIKTISEEVAEKTANGSVIHNEDIRKVLGVIARV